MRMLMVKRMEEEAHSSRREVMYKQWVVEKEWSRVICNLKISGSRNLLCIHL